MTNNLIIHTDGGSRGNPGPAAIGIFITDSTGKEIIKIGKVIGTTTNNVAEYTAVIEALKWVFQNWKEETNSLNLFIDSSLVVNQLNGNFKIKDAKLRELVIKVKIIEKELSAKVFYNYIPREKNKIADKLVNDSFDNFHRI